MIYILQKNAMVILKNFDESLITIFSSSDVEFHFGHDMIDDGR
jgi:hypothetical protein